MNLKFQSTTDHFDSKVGVSGMNSVHPAAGYSAAGKSRTQEAGDEFEIPKYDRPL